MSNEVTVINANQNETSLYLLTKAEVDSQVSTAKAFPRDIAQFINNAKAMATASVEIAASCTYALKRQKQGANGQMEDAIIDGPSVRLAEIVVSSYKNLRAGFRIIANDGKKITAQGICHDLENNVATTIEVSRRITTKKGHTFSEDMQIVTGNAAGAIAYRNAVFKVVPGALVDAVWEAAKEKAKGDLTTLVSRRAGAIKYFTGLGIEREKIFSAVGVKEESEIDLDKLQILIGFANAIKNDGAKPADIFDPKPETAPETKIKSDEEQDAEFVAGMESWEDCELAIANNQGNENLIKLLKEKQNTFSK